MQNTSKKEGRKTPEYIDNRIRMGCERNPDKF